MTLDRQPPPRDTGLSGTPLMLGQAVDNPGRHRNGLPRGIGDCLGHSYRWPVRGLELAVHNTPPSRCGRAQQHNGLFDQFPVTDRHPLLHRSKPNNSRPSHIYIAGKCLHCVCPVGLAVSVR